MTGKIPFSSCSQQRFINYFAPQNGNVQGSRFPRGGLCPAMNCSTSKVFSSSISCALHLLSPQSIPQNSLIFFQTYIYLLPSLYHWYKQTLKTKFPVNCAALHSTQGKHEAGCRRCHRRNGGILYYHVIYSRKNPAEIKQATIKYTYVSSLDFI